jgi:hypothetical protein
MGPRGLLAEVVIHDRAIRHIGRMGHFDGEGLIPVAVDASANRLLGREEIHGRGADGLGVGGDLAQRRDVVENPEAAAVGGDDQVVLVVIGVDVETADGSAGQVLAQRLPVIAVVEADVDGGLGPAKSRPGCWGSTRRLLTQLPVRSSRGRPLTMLVQVLPPSVVRQMSGTSGFSSGGRVWPRSGQCARRRRRYWRRRRPRWC